MKTSPFALAAWTCDVSDGMPSGPSRISWAHDLAYNKVDPRSVESTSVDGPTPAASASAASSRSASALSASARAYSAKTA